MSIDQDTNRMVRQVRGSFPSDAALTNAVSRLTSAGFDRANMVLPPTGDIAAEAVKPEDDRRQLRTLHSSTAAAAAAMAGAAVVVATGGAAAAAVAVAAGAGAMAGGGMMAATDASDGMQSEVREVAAAQGKLELAVAVKNETQAALVEGAMRDAGATRVGCEILPDAVISGS